MYFLNLSQLCVCVCVFVVTRNPTFTEILGIHFDRAASGQLYYLNINTTFNSSILFNYRQTESAFWAEYMPLVTGRMVPLYYPPYLDVSCIPFSKNSVAEFELEEFPRIFSNLQF
jgi:hypothetical protein